MLRKSAYLLFAPWVPPTRHDTKLTVPPPPGGECGGSPGVSTGYSERIATTPHWKRMAVSTYEERMQENETRYPFSSTRPGEYDIRYLPAPYPDHLKARPLLEVGEAHEIPNVRIPVIFLVDLFDTRTNRFFGRKGETVYLDRHFIREELLPQRYAIYATPEAYKLLGMPVVDHRIHQEIPKNAREHKKLLEKQSWEEQQWKSTIEYLFRKYEAGPPELLDVAEEWNGQEEVAPSGSAASAKGDGTARKGPVKQRKARKIKLAS